MTATAEDPGLELQDDQLVLFMTEMGRRAVAYLEGKSFAAFIADTMRVDAVSGCLMGLGMAAGEVSEYLSNWLTDVPWDELSALASWRVHHLRTEENLRAVFHAVERLPTVLASLQRLTDPPTL